jgi:3-demethoxyubiquinol 3-hydroxylase
MRVPDSVIVHFDKALRTLFAPAPTVRPIPGDALPDADLSEIERREAAALMRVNHAGEVCAQALYQGQALASQDPAISRTLADAAREETEHLNWTDRRMAELGGRRSLFNPLWYAGSLAIGLVAGRLGDGWNLGFLAETERQVESHLQDHLSRLPPGDRKSWAILDQMKADEAHHAETAVRLGARELPGAVKLAMAAAAKAMKVVAYRL